MSLDHAVLDSDIICAPCTDHKAIKLIIQVSEVLRGPGRWQMNDRVIKSELFKDTFTQFWSIWLGKRDEFKSKLDWWEETKIKIKDIAISCSKRLKKMEVGELRELEELLTREESSTSPRVSLIDETKTRLNALYAVRSEGARIRAKVRWIEEGEKSSNFFQKSRARKNCGSSER